MKLTIKLFFIIIVLAFSCASTNIDFSDFNPNTEEGYIFASLKASFDLGRGVLTFKNLDTDSFFTLNYDSSQDLVAINVPSGKYQLIKLSVANRTINLKDDFRIFTIGADEAIYFGEWNFFREVSRYYIYYGSERIKIDFERHRDELIAKAPFLQLNSIINYYEQYW